MDAVEKVCQNCGASYDIHEVECPYCGYINPEGAEEKYFRDLESTREGLDMVDDDAVSHYKSEIRSNSKAMLRRIILAAVVVLAVIAVIAYLLHRSEEQYADNRTAEEVTAELQWQNEHFPELDALYEAGDYEGLCELYLSFYEEEHDLWEYEHYDFCEAYSRYLELDTDLEYLDESGSTQDIGTFLIYDTFYFYYRDYDSEYASLNETELEVLEACREEACDVIYDRLGFTDEQLSELKDTIYDDGFFTYDGCEEVSKEYYKQFK